MDKVLHGIKRNAKRSARQEMQARENLNTLTFSVCVQTVSHTEPC